MNFSSFTFWSVLFFGLATVSFIKLILGKKCSPRFDQFCFIALSLTLLATESFTTVGIFGWVATLAYFGLRFRFTGSLLIVVPSMLTPLFYYKYSGFLNEIVTGERSPAMFLIPMGISFYTFQLISILIDSRRENLPTPRISHFLNYASFFPQIVAGPIERRNDLLPQVEQLRFTLQWNQIQIGAKWIILGMFFKLAIADNYALLDTAINQGTGSAYAVWLEAGFFTFRVYFDFAGYSFVAMGLAHCFGVKVTLNFKSPCLARNIRDYWRRWHVTLSNWFRDYLYIPLGGNKKGFWMGNILIVFFVSGLWHGASWGYITWSMMHGFAFLSVSLLKGRKLPLWIAWSCTTAFGITTRIFYKEADWGIAAEKFLTLGTPYAYELSTKFTSHIMDPKSFILCFCISIITILILVGEAISVRRAELYSFFLANPIQVILVILTVFMAPTEESAFIYFNF